MRPNTSIVTTAFAGVPAEARFAAYDWQALAQDLDGFGCAVLPKLLSPVECHAISSASGPLWRSFLSGSDRDPSLGAGHGFHGGEFVLTEQRPRMQSRAEVVPLRLGDAVAFAVHNRPVRGSKGNYRVNLRHGVSRLRSGMRHTVGIILHDAK
jgi:hypothetical protein